MLSFFYKKKLEYINIRIENYIVIGLKIHNKGEDKQKTEQNKTCNHPEHDTSTNPQCEKDSKLRACFVGVTICDDLRREGFWSSYGS